MMVEKDSMPWGDKIGEPAGATKSMAHSTDSADFDQERHPRAMEPATLLYTLLLSVLGAIIGMQILTTLGVTPNTSIIGVLLAIALSRAPLRSTRSLRSIHRQNLLQTGISSSTFGAANSLLMPIGVPLLLGRADLLLPMLVGATMGMLIDLFMLYGLFDSRLFPGSAPWPVGVAAAEAILAGDKGGRRRTVLGLGALAGAIGSSGLFGLTRQLVGLSGVPMSAFGIACIGDIGALTMFGIGLILRAYSPRVVGIDLAEQYVPHGIMIGAGLVALVQALVKVTGRSTEAQKVGGEDSERTRSRRTARRFLVGGITLYIGAACLLAVAGGLVSEMSGARLAAWVLFAAVACVAAEFIVGFSAMHAGWFPAFATALLFLLTALLLGFPPVAAALLVGFVASGGPAFADAGFDFKTGWYLRGSGENRRFELEGRRQQLLSAAIGLLVGLVMVVFFHDLYFGRDLIPPVARVYAAAIQVGVDPSLGKMLLLWAVPGALIQLVGKDRQLGVLLGTGLLIPNGAAGWVVLVAIAVRLVLDKIYGPRAKSTLIVFAAGCIAGDALWTFGDSVFRLR
jgi:uncharacterized oligopeptide transporter (OPT) family protein